MKIKTFSLLVGLLCIIIPSYHLAYKGNDNNHILNQPIFNEEDNSNILHKLAIDNNYYKKMSQKSLLDIISSMDLSAINQKNNFGKTPLFYSMCMMYGVDFCNDYKKRRFLKDMTKLLLSNGANPNIPTNEGNVPLHFSAEMGDANHTNLLLKCGAKPNIANNNGDTPLSLAIKRLSHNKNKLSAILYYPSLINQMIAHGAQMQSHDIEGFYKLRDFFMLREAIKPGRISFTKLVNKVTLDKWLQDNSNYNRQIKPQHIVSRFKDPTVYNFSKDCN